MSYDPKQFLILRCNPTGCVSKDQEPHKEFFSRQLPRELDLAVGQQVENQGTAVGDGRVVGRARGD